MVTTGKGRMTSVLDDHDNIPVKEHTAKAEAILQETARDNRFHVHRRTHRNPVRDAGARHQSNAFDTYGERRAGPGRDRAKGPAGVPNVMRKEDHQLLYSYYVGEFTMGV